MKKYFVSILTATYNRGENIKKLYQSLANQTNFDFEWVVIDDGSGDNTENIMQEFIQNGSDDFSIKYVKKENGGKHTALNVAHDYVFGNVVFMVDSDDELTSDAVEVVIDAWKKYDEDDIGIVAFERMTSSGEKLGSFPDQLYIGSDLNYKVKLNLKGDYAETIKTSVFKKFKFPVFEGERFSSEGWLFKSIMLDGWQSVNISYPICVGDYLDGGLTRGGLASRLKAPKGMMLNTDLNLRVANRFSQVTKQAIIFDIYSLEAGEIFSRDRFNEYKILKILSLPFAAIIRWAVKMRRAI